MNSSLTYNYWYSHDIIRYYLCAWLPRPADCILHRHLDETLHHPPPATTSCHDEYTSNAGHSAIWWHITSSSPVNKPFYCTRLVWLLFNQHPAEEMGHTQAVRTHLEAGHVWTVIHILYLLAHFSYYSSHHPTQVTTSMHAVWAWSQALPREATAYTHYSHHQPRQA